MQIAAAISSPTEGELIIGALILLLLMAGVSLGLGWLLSKLIATHNRRKSFLWISSFVFAALLISLIALLFLFVF
jgi:hypothetical protein